MDRLEFLIAEMNQVPYTSKKDCIWLLNEKLNDLIYYLEAQGQEADRALLHIKACCWMMYEGKHVGTEEHLFLTFHYIKDKAERACLEFLRTKSQSKVAA